MQVIHSLGRCQLASRIVYRGTDRCLLVFLETWMHPIALDLALWLSDHPHCSHGAAICSSSILAQEWGPNDAPSPVRSLVYVYHFPPWDWMVHLWKRFHLQLVHWVVQGRGTWHWNFNLSLMDFSPRARCIWIPIHAASRGYATSSWNSILLTQSLVWRSNNWIAR